MIAHAADQLTGWAAVAFTALAVLASGAFFGHFYHMARYHRKDDHA